MNRTLKTLLFTTLAITSAAVAGLYAAYKTRRQWIGNLLHLAPARYEVGVETHLRVPMPDGITLEAEHYFPQAEGSFPTILFRTPYGLSTDNARPVSAVTNFPVQRFVERGYHVVVQSVRGRFGSEGHWMPFFDEASDGRATLDWIAQQPWFNGSLGLFGGSYVGYTQWAIAADAPEYVKAMVPAITTANLPASMWVGDQALGLDTTARWMLLTVGPNYTPSPLGLVWLMTATGQDQYLAKAFQHLPLQEIDEVITGQPIDFFRDWLGHPTPTDPHWQSIDFRRTFAQVSAPMHLVTGWYDLFARYQLEDYQLLKAAGHQPYLTVGPTIHTSLENYALTVQEGLAWFDAYLKNDPSHLRRHPVRLFVMGSQQWRELDDWPPPAQDTHFFLHDRQRLMLDQTTARSTPDRYIYDPGDPTPAIGGPLLSFKAGPHDQRPLESRSDVLLYTSDPLADDLEVMGVPRAELYVRSSNAHTDFVARLCDVQSDGRSINLCDGFIRLEPGCGEPQPDGSLKITIELWPTANCFRRGHRLRLHVCSGGHPRWSRNLGTGESLATATGWQGAEQLIYHDAAHPSALILPVTSWWSDVEDIEVLQYS
ncbi:Cocaine esterase [Thermoflexales bacterium]|nr:Cocaine esterase [Thermoflexales bacterium]